MAVLFIIYLFNSKNLGRGGNHPPPSVDVLQKMAPVDEG